MAEIKITYSGETSRVGSVKITAFTKNLSQNLHKAFRQAGSYLARRIQKNLKGQSHTNFPGTSNPFPGVVSGKLWQSVNFKLLTGMGMTQGVEIGPGGYATRYAAVQEFGATINVTNKMRKFLHRKGIHLRADTNQVKIPARPYVKPTWVANKDQVIKNIQDTIMGPIRR